MKKGKTIFNWVSMVITLTAVIIMAYNTDFSQFVPALTELKYIWLVIAFFFIILSWLFDTLTIKQILSGITGKITSMQSSFRYSMAGLYYMALTPFGSAGQPMQMVYMAKDGIPVGKTTAAASIKFFTDKIAVCVIFIAFLLISGIVFFSNHTAIFWLSILAFVMNLVILVGVFLLIIKPAFAGHFFKGGIHLLSKLKLVKHKEKAIEKTDAVIKDYSVAAEFVLDNRRKTAILALISILRRILLIAIPFLLYRAFGFSAIGMIEIMALNVFMSLAITLMPTPGAALAAEGGFSTIYSGMFGAAIVPAVVIWRLLTYYLIIALGSCMVLKWNISPPLIYQKCKTSPPLIRQHNIDATIQ